MHFEINRDFHFSLSFLKLTHAIEARQWNSADIPRSRKLEEKNES